ncbi:GFA family protein [Aliiruegeria sabulilitoris]|uniref:GFA family protein n=1 Tax=Aliiruegeria sabulilitoris TaxID=1510458 RepID=UPI0008339D70|nr:GFA family protein [Aliiruegeria sabulilitoris]NDR56418.1 GFA family protein [Pseudoruegeria sp. M32A2M]
MSTSTESRNGACHCGAVRFRVRLSDGLATARRCSCSYCRMRGAVAVSAPLDGIEILSGAENLTLYQFNTGTAKHYFCKTCGIYTHHQRRSNPEQYGVNAACLEGVSPFDFSEIVVNDGVNHPADRASSGETPVSGILQFISD